ncbi:glycosyltransferase [Agromyces marinus]|uniref:glycosyltransferase n=1 Tax=Agromyces marinus TaxID=1389020 RepID=UPI001F39C82B|nr:glycosyltransferase [Agromyces marinus]
MIPPEEIDLLAADGNVLMVVDGDVRGVRAHLYLDQNLGADRHPWPDIARDRQLLGAQYALIRRSVVEARRPRPWNWPEREAPRLVVMLGGSDPRGLTGLVAAELARIDHDLRVTVVVPPGAREAVARRLGADPRFSLIETTPRLVDHLAAADLVVSAAGTTAWEICTLGLPAVLLAVVDNQRESLARASELGLCVGADVTERDDLGGLAESVRSLIADEPLRRRLSERCLEHFDGGGARRVAETMERHVYA